MASTEMIWLLIANASRARIFEWLKGQGGHLREVADFAHPQSRMKGSELSSDRAGHAQRTQGDGDIGGRENGCIMCSTRDRVVKQASVQLSKTLSSQP